jgi:enterochelin esterase-like enzyme
MKSPVVALAVFVLSVCASATQQLTPADLAAQMKRRSVDKTKLAEQVRSWVGDKQLKAGADVRTDGLQVAWAIEGAGVKEARVVSQDGKQAWKLQRLGRTDVFALATQLEEGAGFRWHYELDGRAIGDWRNLEVYSIPAESRVEAGVPRGKVTQMPRFKSAIFEGTERDWWIYVPSQYREDSPACLMVFQDGQGAKDYTPAYFDNLIAKGEMPATVGVFISPGTFADKRSDRSREYDTLSDAYVRFLLEEILPEVEKTVRLRHDPASRAIAGISSGGICAFTAAWERPDQFGKVLSWVGSFTDIAHGASLKEGGHNYPALIRLAPKKPIRVYLQDGENDLDNQFGSWWLANLQMARSLEFAKYDYKFVGGHGFHSDRHGRAVFADALRWLWRP